MLQLLRCPSVPSFVFPCLRLIFVFSKWQSTFYFFIFKNRNAFSVCSWWLSRFTVKPRCIKFTLFSWKYTVILPLLWINLASFVFYDEHEYTYASTLLPHTSQMRLCVWIMSHSEPSFTFSLVWVSIGLFFNTTPSPVWLCKMFLTKPNLAFSIFTSHEWFAPCGELAACIVLVRLSLYGRVVKSYVDHVE